jgi:hypothetical protein
VGGDGEKQPLVGDGDGDGVNGDWSQIVSLMMLVYCLEVRYSTLQR